MSVELLSIGNELLSGHTINTNASAIAQKLLIHGFAVDRVTTLPDDLPSLKKGIEEAIERSSVVITSGGLGPTGDDLTRDVISEIYQTPLYFDETVAANLRKRFGENLPTLDDQARVPKGAKILPNPLGTAPGFILTGKATIIVLPGVPSQMEAMLDGVISHLKTLPLKKHAIATLYLALLSEQQVDPTLRELEKMHPGVQIGICPGYGILSIYLHAEEPSLLPPVQEKIAKEFRTSLYSTTRKEIECSLHEWMVQNKKTFAAGESCTGGYLASRLTRHAGSSDYFLGSIVAYSNHLKETALGVSSEILKKQGAVSRETVIEMAKGVQKLTGADYVITTSGVAGPSGGTPEKPVGTVWSAILTPEKIFAGFISKKPSAKSRTLIIEYSTVYLIASLYRYLNHQLEPFS